MRTERSTRPFEVVQVDCCGPWKINVQCRRPKKTVTKEVHAVTIIDDAAGWPEIVRLEGKTAYHLAKKFDAQWLCQYPRPDKVICDNCGEFIGREFQELLCSYVIQQVPTTVMNPQASGIKERMYLTMADMLRTMTFKVPDDKAVTWRTEVDAILQAVAWAIRSMVHAGMKYAPANLLFTKDMVQTTR